MKTFKGGGGGGVMGAIKGNRRETFDRNGFNRLVMRSVLLSDFINGM